MNNNKTELSRLRKIAQLIGSIFVYGGFKAETHNERELEKLLREQGTFFDNIREYEATMLRIIAEQPAKELVMTHERALEILHPDKVGYISRTPLATGIPDVDFFSMINPNEGSVAIDGNFTKLQLQALIFLIDEAEQKKKQG